MISNTEAAALADYARFAEDVFAIDPTSLAPPADPRLGPPWTLIGHLTAVDHLFGASQTVCYGYMVQSVLNPASYLVAIRGTATMAEWVEDAEFTLTSHPVVGQVEAGFWSIYASMQYCPIVGAGLPAAQGLTQAIGKGHLTIVGHSLGAALATYLAFDMPPDQIEMAVFASPRTGNAPFTAAFHARVKNYNVWNYLLDAVPHVPMGLDYAPLPAVTVITPDNAQARIRLSLLCAHHLLSYSNMLNYTLSSGAKLSAVDQPFCACIKGPAALTATAA